jgi:threonyl-tRNA synthetase
MYPFMELKEKHETASGAIEEVKETYVLRPMNCPHHHKIFGHRPRSYRELPLRLAEYGQVYRFEDSGAVSGLLRVRGMCMNDAHIYCTEDQIQEEFLAVMRMHQEAYKTLGISRFYMRFSTWDPADPKGKQKYVDNPKAWEWSQTKVKDAMLQSGLDFVERKGEAAFYGPKIDFQFRTVTGREETASTNQLDFAVPGRLGLTYIGADNQEHVPYCIHRAPLGTHERFTAFLIEHFGAAFPTWLAPVQVRVVTVSDTFNDYADKVVDRLRSQMIRIERDPAPDTMGKKIRNATKQKIPNILVVGEKEQADQTVTLRKYGVEQQQTISVEAFESWLLEEVRARKLPQWFTDQSKQAT